MNWNSLPKHPHPFPIKLVLILSFILTFTACSAEANSRLHPDEVMTSLLQSSEIDVEWMPVSERYLASVFDNKVTFPESRICYRNNLDGMDEIGIFACKNKAEAKELKDSITIALKARKDGFDDRYFSEELPKFEHARAIQDNNYVLYAIVSPEKINQLELNFHTILKEQ